MKIMIRLSCAAAAALALAAGSASAGNGVRDDFWQQGDPIGDEPSWTTDPYGNVYPAYEYGDPSAYYGDSYTVEYYGDGGDPTGGCAFYETMNGDAMAIASSFGFDVSDVYAGSCVADPTDANGWFDAMFLCAILNGADPFCGAEPDDFVRAPEGSGFAGFVLGSSFGRAQYQRQTAVTTIRGRQAHELATGAGVTVAVLDTGVDATHTLFTVPVGRVLAGYDFVDLDEDAGEERGDAYGHGTIVSGLVLLAAPGARILPLRVLDADGVGTAGRIAAGIRYAADAGASVVNLSLGGKGESSAVRDALVDAMARGVVVVAASGNSRRRATKYPAAEDGVIAATGSGGRDGDVWAPSIGLAGPYPQQRWFRGIGTSFSCALVSGGVALAKQRNPLVAAPGILAALGRRRNGARVLDLEQLAGIGPADVVHFEFADEIK